MELTKSPAARIMDAEGRRRRRHRAGCARPVQAPCAAMLTTDLSLRFDPVYEKISRRFYEHPISSPMRSPGHGSN
jgi:catalase-peroxidase